MPRKRTSQFWVDMVRTIAKEDETAGARLISSKLEGVPREDWPIEGNFRIPPPGERTISTLLSDFRRLTAEQQAPYGRYTWPDSHEQGLIPWEASRLGLDLLRAYRLVGAPPPTVQRVLWNWRLWLASPALEPLARDLEVTSILWPDEKTMARMEHRLAFEPWRKDEGHHRYRAIYNEMFPGDRWGEDNAKDQ